MKKFLLSAAVLALVCTSVHAWGREIMDTIMSSWYGESIDSVINKWGYPTDEKSIAGKKLIIWSEGTEHSVDTWGDSDKDGWSWGTATVKDEEVCTRTFEVDEHNKVVRGQWKGESCPMTQFGGKKWINPRNNPWNK